MLPQGVGIFTAKHEASFQVMVKPSSSQKGDSIVLIKNSKLSGEDTFTKQNIIVSAGDLTSNDLVDRPGEGVVK